MNPALSGSLATKTAQYTAGVKRYVFVLKYLRGRSGPAR